MPDKEILQAVLDAVGVTRGRQSDRESSRCGRPDGGPDCAVPELAVYIIICNCVTINNGACEDWEFCKSNCRPD